MCVQCGVSCLGCSLKSCPLPACRVRRRRENEQERRVGGQPGGSVCVASTRLEGAPLARRAHRRSDRISFRAGGEATGGGRMTREPALGRARKREARGEERLHIVRVRGGEEERGKERKRAGWGPWYRWRDGRRCFVSSRVLSRLLARLALVLGVLDQRLQCPQIRRSLEKDVVHELRRIRASLCVHIQAGAQKVTKGARSLF